MPVEPPPPFDDTPLSAEQRIMAYLREAGGEPVSEWAMLNDLVTLPVKSLLRKQRRFYLGQLMRLVREGKVRRYRKFPLKGKIRISQIYL